MADRIQLGMKVRDQLSQLEGQVVAISKYLYGCTRVSIQPFGSKDGKPFEWVSVDEPQVDVIDDAPAAVAEPRHGPRPDVSRQPDVQR